MRSAKQKTKNINKKKKIRGPESGRAKDKKC